jgi:hypothetical protein
MSTPSPAAARVLICHAPADAGYAARLAESLTAAGIPSWYDPGVAAGRGRSEAVRDQVDACAAVVLMSAAGQSHERLRQEIIEAMQARRPVAPLLLDGEPFVRLNLLPYEEIASGEMPSPAFLDSLRSRVVPGAGGATRSARPRRTILVAAAAVLVAALVATGITFILTRPVHRPDVVLPTAPSLAPGKALMDLTANGPVDRCQAVSGWANLQPDQTLYIAIRRTRPSSSTYFISPAGTYSEGHIPATWSGVLYFGSSVNQSYAVFLMRIGVTDARAYWTSHRKPGDGFVADEDLPSKAEVVQRVDVEQNTLNGC